MILCDVCCNFILNLHLIRVEEQENGRNTARREQDQSHGVFFPEQDEASPRLQSLWHTER